MKANEQTLQQLDRFMKKVVQKFPDKGDDNVLTDIHLRVSQESGELLAFDDDDNEITRCVIEQWIDAKDENFYPVISEILHRQLLAVRSQIDAMGIMKPYSFVLESDEKEHLSELYVVDDDTIILGGNIMQNLDKDLDNFIEELLK